jgi:hypothetical protein
MIHFITYGTDDFKNTKKRLYKEALNSGWFDSITIYNTEDLDDEFKLKYKNILKEKKLGGYCLWKPYFIKKHLNKIQDGDILVYLDAGSSINKYGEERFREYINMFHNNDSGIISFKMPHIEKFWTSKEIFQYFEIDNNLDIKNSGQIIANTIIIKKNPNSTMLIDLWNQVLLDNPLLFTDYYNTNQESYFKENRHDQSTFSVIIKIHESIANIIEKDESWFSPFGSEESLKYPFWATRLRHI